MVRQVCCEHAEFGVQLSRLQRLAERVPHCIVQQLLQSSLGDCRAEVLRLHAEFLGFHTEHLRQKVTEPARFLRGGYDYDLTDVRRACDCVIKGH